KIQVFLKNLKVKTESEIEVEDNPTATEIVEPSEDTNPEDNPIVSEPEINSDVIPPLGNDLTKYSFDGFNNLGKGQLAVKIVEKYVSEHPEYTFDQIKETFPDSMMGPTLKLIGLIVKGKDLKDAPYSYQKKAYGFFNSSRKMTSSDGIEYYISNYWNITNIQSIIDFAKAQGWEVTIDE
ncbi:MAG: hypothetical protein NC453_23295, partial [Muribaculum sp.]|nr:hypothetical protein [Muribaculum sp.]